MNFSQTSVAGAFVVSPEAHSDERGLFARTWDAELFAQHGLGVLSQCSVSYNPAERTLRGMHFQVAPHEEVKLVRCIRGRIQDVVVDVRPESPTYLQWASAVLGQDDRRALLVPPGCAHGFLTLEPHCEVLYAIAGGYEPTAARGVRWDDPAFGVRWEAQPEVMSARDATYADHVR